MTTLTQPAATAPALPEPAARAAWRRRVARIGSLIQLAFAALWLTRGTLATGWPGQLPIALTLAAAAVALGIWGALTTRGLAPRPRGPAAHRLERAITIATAIQLAASCALPVIVSAAGRADLTVPAIAVTIGLLLLWLRARLTTPGHLTAGILLIAVPGALALALTGNTLTAAAGLATAAILIGSALTGFRALASGALGPLPPAPGNRPRPAAQPVGRSAGLRRPAAHCRPASQRAGPAVRKGRPARRLTAGGAASAGLPDQSIKQLVSR